MSNLGTSLSIPRRTEVPSRIPPLEGTPLMTLFAVFLIGAAVGAIVVGVAAAADRDAR